MLPPVVNAIFLNFALFRDKSANVISCLLPSIDCLWRQMYFCENICLPFPWEIAFVSRWILSWHTRCISCVVTIEYRQILEFNCWLMSFSPYNVRAFQCLWCMTTNMRHRLFNSTLKCYPNDTWRSISFGFLEKRQCAFVPDCLCRR